MVSAFVYPSAIPGVRELALHNVANDGVRISLPSNLQWSANRSCIVLTLVTVCCLLPFSGRAFHVDDTLFVRAAQNIAKHPFDPYGFQITWDAAPQPMSDIMQNPPLASYYAALVGSVFGWSERALHLGFLLIALLLVLGTWRLARRFTRYPLLAALGCLLAPGLLVSACSVMCDTMMLMISVWAAIFWVEGLERPRILFPITAALLIGLATLTKYFAISLIPLLAAYSLLRLRRIGAWTLYFVIPVAMLIWYQIWSKKVYGHGLLVSAAHFASAQRANVRIPWPTMALMGLSFAGGCTLIVLTFAVMLWPRRALVAALLAGAAMALAIARGWLGAAWQLSGGEDIQRDWLSVDIQLTFCIAAGILLVLLAVTEFKRGDSDSVFLVLWLLGTLVFATFINYTLNARSILPLIPAASILMVRRLERGHPADLRRRLGWSAAALAISGTVSLIVAAGDTALANSGRRAAETAIEKAGDRTGALWFEGHWGFQYYMELGGGRPLNMSDPEMGAGDAVVIPHNNIRLKMVSGSRIAAKQEFEIRTGGWASTIDPWHRAGFYSAYWGPLPYYLGAPPVERYTIVQIAGPAQPSK